MKIEFLCEACGASVNSRAVSCPACNRLFSGVQCPRCHSRGNFRKFLHGCKTCGFTADTIPLEMIDGRFLERRWYRRPSWPASRYWTYSVLLLISIAAVLHFWMNN